MFNHQPNLRVEPKTIVAKETATTPKRSNAGNFTFINSFRKLNPKKENTK